MTAFDFKMEIRKLSRRLSCSSKYAELGHFALLFYRGRQRNVQRFITHVHSHFLLTKPFVWWRFRCHCRWFAWAPWLSMKYYWLDYLVVYYVIVCIFSWISGPKGIWYPTMDPLMPAMRCVCITLAILILKYFTLESFYGSRRTTVYVWTRRLMNRLNVNKRVKFFHVWLYFLLVCQSFVAI